MLRSKGIHVTEGFNAFDELPKEILNSQGTMWFVSSKRNQISYEDDRIGGVFSHFFLEGMEQAHFDGFGITLDDIWEYARSNTQRHTNRTGKPQTPEKLVRELTTAAPLYFSFPSPRSATLVFTSDVSGHFLIHYESGQMTELINKEPGQVKHIMLYPGEIILERLDNQDVESQHITLSKETMVWVRKESAWQPNNQLGVTEKQLVAKGSNINDLILTQEVPAWSGLLELDYRATIGSEFSPTPLNNGSLGFRLDHNWMIMRTNFSYGHSSRDYPAWGYKLDRYDVSFSFGGALDWRHIRFDLSASALVLFQDMIYQDNVKRSRTGFGLGVETGVLVPLFHKPFDFYLSGRIGCYAQLAHPLASQNASAEWGVIPVIEAGIVAKLF